MTVLRLAASLLLVAFPAFGQDAAGWQYRITPYLWAPSLDSTVAIGRDPPVSGSTSVLEILDGALLLSGEARHGDYAVIGEFNYLNLGERASGPNGLVGADLSLEGVMGALTGAATLAKGARWRVEALAGLRIWSLEASVDFDNLPNASRTSTWVDPIIGGRGEFAITESIALQGLANIGGFGVGSDVQYELLARAGWQINDRFTAAIGYRHLAVEFDDEGLLLDMTLTGPFLAVDVNF